MAVAVVSNCTARNIPAWVRRWHVITGQRAAEEIHGALRGHVWIWELDFQFNVGDKKSGAPFHGLKAFFTTPQLSLLDKVCSDSGPI